MYWLVIIFLFVAVTGFMVWASAYIGSGVYLKSYCSSSCDEKYVALTFDDGPATMTSKVLEVLKEHNVKATFFLIGSKIQEDPDTVRRIADEGHTIGNHSWSHSSRFPIRGYSEVLNEIKMTSEKIYDTIGRNPKLFRPPFGVTNPRIGKAVRAQGLISIGWNIRSLDTICKRTREDIMLRISSQLRPGSVILLHDRCKDSDRLLEMLLQYLDKNGYKVVTIEEMFNLKSYD